MTDTTEQTEAPAEAKAPAAAPVRPCFCQTYELIGESEDDTFRTDCDATTKSTFAQGHDARLISFLVDGHFDGYKIRQVSNGTATVYPTPEAAAVLASPALGGKAAKATANRQTAIEAKKQKAAEREAAKAVKKAEKEAAAAKKAADKEAKDTAAKTKGVDVVAGSREGDPLNLPEGHHAIVVGKFEYVATIDDDGNASYIDGAGDEQTIERDGYRLLA